MMCRWIFRRRAHFDRNNAVRLLSGGPGYRSQWNDCRQARYGIADLAGVDLHGADLRGFDLAGLRLEDANLQEADLRNANLCNSSLRRACLTGACLDGSRLVGALLDDAVLFRASARGVTLENASLRGTDLSRADLTGADLTDARILSANTYATVLADVDVRRARLFRPLVDTIGRTESLELLRGGEGGIAKWNEWRREGHVPSLSGANLSGAALPQVNMSKCDLTRAIFSGALMPGADLRYAKLAHAALDNADLSGAKLGSADLAAAVLTGVNLQGASLREAKLQDALLSHALLGVPRGQEHVRRLAGRGDAMDMTPRQLGGAELTGAAMPSYITKFECLDNVAEAAKQARTMFLLLVTVCVSSVLVVMATVAEERASAESYPTIKVPVLGVEIPASWFCVVVPAMLLAFYGYFHLHLQRLWYGLSGLPAVFPDGTPLFARAYPWMLTCLVLAYFPRLRRNRPRMVRLHVLVSIAMGWAFVPASLWFFAYAHHALLDNRVIGSSAVPGVLAVAASEVGLVSYIHARRVLART